MLLQNSFFRETTEPCGFCSLESTLHFKMAQTNAAGSFPSKTIGSNELSLSCWTNQSTPPFSCDKVVLPIYSAAVVYHDGSHESRIIRSPPPWRPVTSSLFLKCPVAREDDESFPR